MAVKTGRHLWDVHPHVRSHGDLTLGERAADKVKTGLGSWAFIFAQTMIVICWAALNVVGFAHHWDPYPFILLNLLFSTQAAYAAPILQLSQNRNDRISAEVATGTLDNSKRLLEVLDQVLKLQQTQMQVLATQDQVLAEIRVLADTRKAARKPAKPAEARKVSYGVTAEEAAAKADQLGITVDELVSGNWAGKGF